MPNPDDILEVARRIYKDPSMCNEEGVKTAAGRCYYSSLHTVKPHLKAGPGVHGDDLHKIAIRFVRGLDASMGDRLKYLYDHRVEADIGCDGDVVWDRDLISRMHGMAKSLNSDIRSAVGR